MEMSDMSAINHWLQELTCQSDLPGIIDKVL